jgi:hypothetical protein
LFGRFPSGARHYGILRRNLLWPSGSLPLVIGFFDGSAAVSFLRKEWMDFFKAILELAFV